MIIDFRKIKILYTFVMPFFVIVALVVLYLTKNLAYPVLIFLGALLLNNYLFRIILDRQYNKMDKTLYENCDSERYLKSVDASIVAAKASRMYGPGTQVAILTRKATALVNLGRFKEARDVLSKATISKINKGEGYEIPFYIVYQIIKFEGDNIHTFFEEFDEYLSQTDLNTKRGSN